jgi:hypothetical protein
MSLQKHQPCNTIRTLTHAHTSTTFLHEQVNEPLQVNKSTGGMTKRSDVKIQLRTRFAPYCYSGDWTLAASIPEVTCDEFMSVKTPATKSTSRASGIHKHTLTYAVY